MSEHTTVETPRFTGGVYIASASIRVGSTQGRVRYDRQKQYENQAVGSGPHEGVRSPRR